MDFGMYTSTTIGEKLENRKRFIVILVGDIKHNDERGDIMN